MRCVCFMFLYLHLYIYNFIKKRKRIIFILSLSKAMAVAATQGLWGGVGAGQAREKWWPVARGRTFRAGDSADFGQVGGPERQGLAHESLADDHEAPLGLHHPWQ